MKRDKRGELRLKMDENTDIEAVDWEEKKTGRAKSRRLKTKG